MPEPTRVLPLWRIWRAPVMLALLTLSGLISALLSEGIGDQWAWFALGLPVAVIARYGLVPRTRATQDMSEESSSPIEESHP